MTEIIIKEIENKGFCAVDNHNLKKGKTFSIIFRSKEKQVVERYLNSKGV